MSEHFDRHLEELGPVDARKQQELCEQGARGANAARMGAPAKWTDEDRQQVTRLIDDGLSDGRKLNGVIREIRRRLPGLYGRFTEGAIRDVYYREKRTAKLKPDKAHIAQVEQWGKLARPPLKSGEAKALVAELWVAAGTGGATWRQASFDKIFDICARKYGVVDHEKIDYLRGLISKFNDDPTWFPRERPEIRDRSRRDRILKITNEAPDKQADFALYMAETGWSLDAVKN